MNATRIANAKIAIDRAGGVGKVAKLMDYANPSFLSQMFGPNPERPVSEKTARRMESALGLPDGTLDTPGGADELSGVSLGSEPSPTMTVDSDKLTDAIALVASMAREEGVVLSATAFADLAMLAYEDSADHGGTPRASNLRRVMRLLHKH